MDELKYRILEEFGFTPTVGQGVVIDTFARFAMSGDARSAMILRGSAGTGKTSLAGAMVRAMRKLGRKLVLLAPTGRAAKVFSLNSGNPAYTIHRYIYRQRSLSADGGQFNLNYNKHRDTLFIVDEASMVTDKLDGGSMFSGVGYLLDDLISFVYGGVNCRIMFIGDMAQLPPVGEEESPALSSNVLEGYGLTVFESNLDEVLRQSAGSGILTNATAIRSMITRDEVTMLPKIRFVGFADISVVRGDELVESLATSYSSVGMDETIVVTRSNKRAGIYNRGIRGMVLDREEELTTGDMLMVVKNNYFYGANIEERGERRGEGGERKEERDLLLSSGVATKAQRHTLSSFLSPLSSIFSFIANGDRARVRRVRNVRELYGFRFADLCLVFPDYDDTEVDVTAILDSLYSDAPALTREENAKLFDAVMEDYAHIPLKADRMKEIRCDRYYNALQVKFAYAVTCHKAQGGQWAHVYIDQGYMTDDMLNKDYIHWLYTAFTRATEHLFLVNWTDLQTETASGQE